MKASVLLLLCLVSLEVISGARRSGGGSRSSSSSSSRSSSSRSSSGSYGGGSSSYGSRGSSSSRSSSGSSRSSSGSVSSRGTSGGTSSRGSNTARNNWGTGTSSRNSGTSSRNSGSSRSSNSRYTPTKSYQGPKNYGYSKNPSAYSKSYGYSSSSGKGLSYRSPGYGTNWGTSFGSGSHRVGRNGYSKKALGLGVAAGFVGGAAIGGAATYGVYHRYNKYREMMYMNRYGYGFGGGHEYNDGFGWGGRGFSSSYYNDYYLQDRCMFGCPGFAVCRYGFCECPYGYTRRYGRCSRDWSRESYRRPPKFDPLSATCLTHQQCWDYDQNMICPEEKLTTAGTAKCQCRTDMKWNSQESQCELYLDVDCSNITYDTPPDPLILKAVEITIARVNQTEENAGATNILVPGNETDSAVKNETLAAAEAEKAAAAAEAKSIDRATTLDNSLLESIDPRKDSGTTQAQITEAYCRDIDSLSFEFQKQEDPRRESSGGGMGVGGIIGIIILVLLLISCCCLCGACKKKGGSRAPSPVAFTAVQDHEEMQNMNAGTDQPGFPSATQAYNMNAGTDQPVFPSATQAYNQ